MNNPTCMEWAELINANNPPDIGHPWFWRAVERAIWE